MEDSNQNILQLCAVLIIVTHYNAARHRSSLHRAALLPPCLSPWERLYTSADDSSFLTITGFNRESFEGLKDILFQSLPVTAGLIDLVLRTIGNYAMYVDQGFPRSGDLFDKFVGPMSKKVRRQLTSLLRDLLEARHATYISLRQSSEWGMRGLQGSFSRLKARLTSNKEKRKLIILSIILLHNFRTEYVGLNQIAEVFNPHYEQYIQLGTYDRIANYFEVVGNAIIIV